MLKHYIVYDNVRDFIFKIISKCSFEEDGLKCLWNVATKAKNGLGFTWKSPHQDLTPDKSECPSLCPLFQ